MRYIIQKKINDLKYWWNDDKGQWEGLKSNASYIYPEELGRILTKVNHNNDQNHISYYPVK